MDEILSSPGIDPSIFCVYNGRDCPPPPPSLEDKEPLNVGLIVGLVLVGLVLCMLFLLCMLKRSHKEAEEEEFLLAGDDLEAAVEVRGAAFSISNPMFNTMGNGAGGNDGGRGTSFGSSVEGEGGLENPNAFFDNAQNWTYEEGVGISELKGVPAGMDKAAFTQLNPLMRMLRGDSTADSDVESGAPEGFEQPGAQFEDPKMWKKDTARAHAESDALYDNPIGLMNEGQVGEILSSAQVGEGGILAGGNMLATTSAWDKFTARDVTQMEVQFEDNPMSSGDGVGSGAGPLGVGLVDITDAKMTSGGALVTQGRPSDAGTIYNDNPLAN